MSWRGQRVLDFTTCKSLGVVVDAEDNILVADEVVEGSRLAFDVWSEGEWNHKMMKGRGVVDGYGDVHGGDMNGDVVNGAEALPKKEGVKQQAMDKDKNQEPGIKIILTARDLEPYRLIVRPSTTFAKIKNAFRKARKVDETKKITLQFDGYELADEGGVQDTEIEEMENVEVYIK